MADVTIADQTTTTTSALTDNIMIDRAGVNYKISFQTAILDRAYPVGSFYIQYPGGTDPNTAIGGTWLNDSATFAADFFRVDDGGVLASAFNSGVQLDAMQRITGRLGNNDTIINPGGSYRDTSPDVSAGAFTQQLTSTNGEVGSGTSSYNTYYWDFDNNTSVSPNAAKTNDVETRVKNQTIRVWKRTA